MRVSIRRRLFPWDELEDHPALAPAKELLAAIPVEIDKPNTSATNPWIARLLSR